MSLHQFIVRARRRYTQLRPQQAFLLVQALLAAALIFPMGIWRFSRGEFGQGSFDLVLVVVFTAMGLLSTQDRFFKHAARVFSVSYTIAVWIVVQFIGLNGLFWAFATAVAIFFAARRKDAVILAVCSYLAALHGIYGKVQPETIYTFTASYTLVVFFCYHFSTRLIKDNLRLTAQAVTDPLTGVENRRALEDAIGRIIDARSDKPGSPHSLIMIDIDDFKVINDTWGHDVGDQVLKRIAETLRSSIATQGRVYRFGGEEFAVLTNKKAADASIVAQQFGRSLASQRLVRDSDRQITASLGVAELNRDEDSRSWFRRADHAMYQAKTSGKNRTHIDTGTGAV